MEKMAECSRRIFPEIMVTLEKLDKRIVLSIRDNGEGDESGGQTKTI